MYVLLRGARGKEPASQCRRHKDEGSIPELGWSLGENGNPLRYSCLENPMDRGARWATVRGVAKSWTRLSNLAAVSAALTPGQVLFILDANDSRC